MAARRITIITGPFLPVPPGPAGATEKIWARLAEEFAKRGLEVTLLSRRYPGLPDDEVVNGVRHLRRGGSERTSRLPIDLVKDFFYGLRVLPGAPRSDILVTNSFWLPVLAPLLRADIGRIFVSVERFPKGQMRLYRRAARLRAPSNSVRAGILDELPAGHASVRVIPNPVDLDTFYPPPVERDYRGPLTLLYTGRVNPEKGVHLLIRAFGLLAAGHPRLRLRITGPTARSGGGGGQGYVDTLRRLADGLPVEFTGPIDKPADLAAVLRAAHFYCYPSVADRGEAFPVAPLEAMATGLAPVISNLDCFRDYIEDGFTGLFFDHSQPSTAQNLAESLGRLLENPRRASEMGVAAAAAASRFSYAGIAQQFISDFNEIAGED